MACWQFASPEQIPALKQIWLQSFPEDDEAAAATFFSSLFRPEECLVHVEDGTPVSMVFMLPARLCVQEKQLPIQYIYAAATHPHWRGWGIFASLLRQAHKVAAERGQIASFLRPGEESLIGYYARFGYEPWFVRNCYSLTALEAAQAAPAAVADCPAECYAAVRNRMLSSRSAWVAWEERFAAYAARAALSSGGCVLQGEKGCALCEKQGNRTVVKELLCPPEEQAAFCAAISRRMGGMDLQVSVPAEEGAEKNPFGLWCPLAEEGKRLYNQIKTPYMGLALD